MTTGHLKVQKNLGIREHQRESTCEEMRAVRAARGTGLKGFGYQTKKLEFCPKRLKVVGLNLFFESQRPLKLC